MTPKEFEKAGVRLYGKRWKTAMARMLGRDVVTVWRYAMGGTPIPLVVKLAVKGARRRTKA